MREGEHDVDKKQAGYSQAGAKTDHEHLKFFTLAIFGTLNGWLVEMLTRRLSREFTHVYSPYTVGAPPDRRPSGAASLTHDIR